MTKRIPRCMYQMRYLGRVYCREVWKWNLLSEAKELHHGCPTDCSRYAADIYDVGDLETPIEQVYDGVEHGGKPPKDKE